MTRKQPTPGNPSRLALANWPVSVRLSALFVLASLTGLIFGGLRVADAAGAASAYARTTRLAVLGEQVTAFAQALEDERDLTAGVTALTTLSRAAVSDHAAARVAAQRSQALTAEQASLSAAQRVTTSAAELTAAGAAGVGSGFPASVQVKAAGVITQARNLAALRAEVAGGPPSAVIGDYSTALASLFAFNDEITSASGDAQLADGARALGALSRASDQASQQRAILSVAFIESGFSDAGNGQPTGTDPSGKAYNNIGGAAALRAAGGLQALIIARSLQLTDVLAFQSAATPGQESAYLAAEASPAVGTALKIDSLVTATGDPHAVDGPPAGLTAATAPGVWDRDVSAMVGGMRAIEVQVASALVARSELLQHQAARSALLTAAVTLVVFLFMLIATALVARSLLHPLRRLQADALEIAAVRLPARVAAAARGTDLAEDAGSGVDPIGVRSTDEIGKVARAFDQVHAEAVRLASTEAQLRGNLNAMFISLSRRSVPLIERLARMIDSLEQNEDDHERLADLFALDHLVTRMRRNSENLLVLGGEEPVRKWSGPVPLADVTNAAAAEIEQYSRVVLTVPPGVAVSGQAAADIVHLLAELIENATLFSPRETQVRVTAREMDRGVAIEVHDDGVGVSATRLADMNWRLDHPPVIDVSVSRHMGLFAVSRLAARHGIRVRLRAGTAPGLSALIWLPAGITSRGPTPVPGSHSRRAVGAVGSPDAVDAASAAASTRPGAGRHRLGLLGSTGDQPVLADAPALADQRAGNHEAARAGQPAGDVQPGGGSQPGGDDQRGRTTTLAWFAAKAPSGRSAPPRDPGSQDTSPQGTGPHRVGPNRPSPPGIRPRVTAPQVAAPRFTPAAGYGDWARPVPGPPPGASPTDTGPASAGPADAGPADTGPADTGPASAGLASAGPAGTGPADAGPGSRTPAGLPRRVSRAAARDAAPVLSAPVPSMPPENPSTLPRRPRSAARTGPRAGLKESAVPPDGPCRRSPEAARSRLAGFQRGSREAAEAEREPD